MFWTPNARVHIWRQAAQQEIPHTHTHTQTHIHTYIHEINLQTLLERKNIIIVINIINATHSPTPLHFTTHVGEYTIFIRKHNSKSGFIHLFARKLTPSAGSSIVCLFISVHPKKRTITFTDAKNIFKLF